ncbi:MAG: MBL fold metallo-hydrolase, partial [Firmicutes bacterium]|nr:MBL fold metallo-hydrolase [Bacillota bacterium]
TLTDEQMKQISGLVAAMVPVGGFYTLDARLAKELCDALKPGIIIPMHYRLGKFGFPNIAELSAFTDLYDSVNYLKSNSMELKPGDKGGVTVLEW